MRSLLFRTYFYVLTFFCAVAFTLAMVRPGDAHIRTMIRGYAGLVLAGLKTLAGIEVELRGLDQVPRDRPFILVSKHMSDLDPIAQFRVMPNMTALAKKELFAIPLIGWILKRLHIIRIDRQSGTAHQQMPDVGRQVTELGQVLVVYPEGTRSYPGERRKLKSGAFHLRDQTGLTIITCATNSGLHWLKGKIGLVPGKVVYEFDGDFPDNIGKQAFMSEIQKRVIRRSEILMEALDGYSVPLDKSG